MRVIGEAEAALQSGDPVEADLLIVHGDLLLATDPAQASRAEEMFERSVAIAAPRTARASQVRALTRLAQLRRGTPAEADAMSSLREIYDGLTEGRELPHLVEARAVLDGVS